MDSNRPAPVGLIKGLSYTFPTSGTIRLGYTRVAPGRGGIQRLPVKDDEFTLTTKVRYDDGEWVRHPLDAKLREAHGESVEDADGQAVRKLRAIPVTLVFDRPELTMDEQFAAFTDRGSPRCVGDGNTARRLQAEGTVSEEDCPGPRSCAFGQVHRCDAFVRLLVRIEGQSETAPPFILRSGSVNAVTDNRVTLVHWASMYGGRLAGLPFTFVLDAKQSALSRQSIFYYGRLEPRFAAIEEGARLLRSSARRTKASGSIGGLPSRLFFGCAATVRSQRRPRATASRSTISLPVGSATACVPDAMTRPATRLRQSPGRARRQRLPCRSSCGS